MYRVIVIDSFESKEKSDVIKKYYQSLSSEIPDDLKYFVQWINVYQEENVYEKIRNAEKNLNEERSFRNLVNFLSEHKYKYELNTTSLVFVFLLDLSIKNSTEKLQNAIEYLEKETHVNIRNCYLITLGLLLNNDKVDNVIKFNATIYANLIEFENLRKQSIQRWSERAQYFYLIPFILATNDHRGLRVQNEDVLKNCSFFIYSLSFSNEHSFFNYLIKSQNIVENGYLTFGSNAYLFPYEEIKEAVSKDMSNVFINNLFNGNVESIAFDNHVTQTLDFFKNFKFTYRNNDILKKPYVYKISDIKNLNLTIDETIKNIRTKYCDKEYFRKFPRIESYPLDLDDLIKRINDWWIILRNGVTSSIEIETKKFYYSDSTGHQHSFENSDFYKNLIDYKVSYFRKNYNTNSADFFRLKYGIKRLIDSYSKKKNVFLTTDLENNNIKEEILRLKLMLRKRPLLAWSLFKGFFLSIPLVFLSLYLQFNVFLKLSLLFLVVLFFYASPLFSYFLYRVKLEKKLDTINDLFFEWYTKKIHVLQTKISTHIELLITELFNDYLNKLNSFYTSLIQELQKHKIVFNMNKYDDPLTFFSILSSNLSKSNMNICLNKEQVKNLKDTLTTEKSIVLSYLSHPNCFFNSYQMIDELESIDSKNGEINFSSDFLSQSIKQLISSLKSFSDKETNDLLKNVTFSSLLFYNDKLKKLQKTSVLITENGNIDKCYFYFNDKKARIESFLQKSIVIVALDYNSLPNNYEIETCNSELIFDQENSSSLPQINNTNEEVILSNNLSEYFLYRVKMLIGIPLLMLGDFSKYAQSYYQLNTQDRSELHSTAPTNLPYSKDLLEKMFDINFSR